VDDQGNVVQFPSEAEASLFFTECRLVLGTIQSTIQFVSRSLSQEVKWPKRNSDLWPPCTAEVTENACRCTDQLDGVTADNIALLTAIFIAQNMANLCKEFKELIRKT